MDYLEAIKSVMNYVPYIKCINLFSNINQEYNGANLVIEILGFSYFCYDKEENECYSFYFGRWEDFLQAF